MFQWAQSTFDKISQTVAPPPTDGAGKFAYCCQRNEEENAMGCIAEIDPVYTVVNQAKGWYPIHMACQYSMIQMIQLLMSQPGLLIEQPDINGNTPLHHAAMSSNTVTGLECVKLLTQHYGASVLAKNAQRQTPYDVASLNSIRQHLLPIQLQAETQIALDNGGQGLPPGIDLGGLRIKNRNMAPPHTSFGSPQPMMQQQPAHTPQTPQNAGPPPPPHMFGTPTPDQTRIASAPATAPARTFSPAPASGPPDAPHAYSRVGSSSAAILSKSKYRADGFHSSSSDVGLQKKYGNVGVQGGRHVPPPPSSGNSIPSAPSSGNAGPNPFAAGANLSSVSRYGALPPTNRRYIAYGQVEPAPASQPVYTANQYAAPMPANVSMFTPGNHQQQQMTQPGPSPVAPQPESTPYQQQQQQQPFPPYGIQTAPYSAPSNMATTPQRQPNYAAAATTTPATPSTPYMPPPPYQSRNYSQPALATTPYQKPDAVSPAAATYGSPATPGTIFSVGTPFQSPPPATDAFAAASPQIVEPAATAPTAAASDVFSAPPQQTARETPVVATSAAAAGDVFSAPSQQTIQEPPAVTTSTFAAGDVFSAPPQQTTQEPSTGAAAVDAFTAPAPATTQESPTAAYAAPAAQEQQTTAAAAFATPATQDQQPSSASANDAFAAPAPQTQERDVSSVFSAPPSTHNQEPGATTVAANVFAPQNQPPATQQAVEPAALPAAQVFGTAAVSPFDIMPQDGLFRAKSAEELFEMDPPSQQQQQSTSETAKELFTENAYENQAAAVFGSGSGSAEEMFGSVQEQEPPATSSGQNASEPNTEQVDFSEGDGEMDDVPLSPSAARPSVSQPAQAQPAAPADNSESLFAAIGMPPPPFSAKKR